MWGVVVLGLLEGCTNYRRRNVLFTILIDPVALGLLLAQGPGRWGTGSTTNSTAHRSLAHLNVLSGSMNAEG